MRRRWHAPAAAVLLALGCLLLTATPAAAHAELVGSTPPSGAHLDRAPAEVVLRFSEQVTPVTGAVRLLDGAGRQVSRSGAARVPGHADWIRLPVPPDLPDGGYVAVWRVISADSHPVDGSVLFTVGNAQAAPLSGVTGVTPPGGTGTLFWLVRGLGFAALALFVGGLGFLAVCWPAGRDNPRARRLVLGGYLASVATAVAALLVQGVYAAGRPLTEVFSPDLVAATLHTGYGVFAVARLALLAAGGGLLWREARGSGARARRWPPVPLLGIAALLPVTWSASGHPRADPQVALAVAADSVHLLAMAVWLGGLAVLFACVLRLAGGAPIPQAATVLTRYSVLAQTAVVTLVLTGTYQAWRILRGDPLTGSGYTRLLVFKVAAFGVLLCLGAASRSMVRRRYLRPLRAAAGGPTRAEPPRSARREARRTRRYDVAALRVMRQSVALELAIAAGVLGLTAALVASSPLAPGPSLRPAGVYNGPYRTEVALTGGGSVLVWLDPARPGSNDLVLDVRDGSGLNRGVPEVRANLVGLAPVTAPAPVTLTRTGVGQYVAHRLPLIGAGTWRLDITVRTSDIDEERVSATIPVS